MNWRSLHPARILPRSLGTRAGLALLLATTSAAVPAYCIHRLLAERGEARSDAEVADLCREILAVAELSFNGVKDWAGPSANVEVLAPILDSGAPTSNSDRGVIWLGVFRGGTEVAEVLRRDPLNSSEIAAQIDFAATAPRRSPLLINGSPALHHTLITRPLAEQGLILAAVAASEPPYPPALATRIGALLAAGIAGVFVAGLWLRSTVLGPVERISRTLGGFEARLTALPNDPTLPAELRELAACAAQCRDEIHRWRSEATQLRYSVETKVDAKTRAVNRALRQAERDAGMDTLTRLANRRVLQQELPELFRAHVAAGQELCVVVIDVDHFKQLNDSLGHQAGDELLAFLGDLIRGSVRRSQDRAVRHGGDEFVLMMPRTTSTEALAIARRLAALFAQRVRAWPEAQPPPALSIGIAARREHHAGSWEDLLGLADQAMYAAKRSRTGVVVFGEFAPAPPADKAAHMKVN